MQHSCRCFDPWFLQGHLWLLAGSLGYALYDIVFGYLAWEALAPAANGLTVVFALCYLVSSVLYLVALRMHYPELARWRGVWLWAEVGNVASSVVYAVSQGLYFVTEYNEPSTLQPFAAVVLAQAALYFVSQLMWLLNAVHYIFAYLAMRKHWNATGPVARDPEFWAEVWNTFACVGYTATTLWALVAVLVQLAGASELLPFVAFVYDNQTLQLLINIAWDLGFCTSAICYLIAWARDRKEALEEAVQEEKPLVVPPDPGSQSDTQDL